MENPNRITQLTNANGNISFTYHNWHAELSAVNDHLLRLRVGKTGQWPDRPDIPTNPAVTNHGDATVATGGRGQVYRAPIITATGTVPLKLQDHRFTLGGTWHIEADCLVLPDQLTLHFPELTADGWQLRLATPGDPAYFGGGTQNGRVSLNGELIQIKNENRWTPGGVASPVPFIWSTAGFGVLANTFTPGSYDFSRPGYVTLAHDGQHVDVYLILAAEPAGLIHGYHELTGLPNLNPRFAAYPGHFNAYNRDYWVPVTAASAGAVAFPDGQWYKEYQPINPKTFNTGYRPGTITVGGRHLVPNVYGNGRVTFTEPTANGNPKRAWRENLNGEHAPQFSARAVINRYAKADLPLGWLIPNDGYGAGYGQTTSFAGDLANLSSFITYARQHGVTTGLWTQAALTPKKPAAPEKGERNLAAELQAGVQAIKTDVAWVGEGYTFGLNATTAAGAAMRKAGLRPMIVTLDGWAGTQRDATVWTGDQAGSDWQNIATQIGSYLSTGLSGNPNVASDVDGIYAGSDPIIQTRDLQWKAFTPYLFAMDGWGDQPKNLGLAFGDPYLRINREFLRYHTQLIPYFRTLAHEARATGAPILRPTFWRDPSPYTWRYLKDQLLLGDAFLLAPITSAFGLDTAGAGRRPHLYLPAGKWRDFWTGTELTGGRTLADQSAPLAQFPVFVRAGSLVPLVAPHQNPGAYPAGRLLDYYPGPVSTITVVNDAGQSLGYRAGELTRTQITAASNATTSTLTVHPTTGDYAGAPTATDLTVFIALPKAPKAVRVTQNGESITVTSHFGRRLGDVFSARRETGLTITVPNVPTSATVQFDLQLIPLPPARD